MKNNEFSKAKIINKELESVLKNDSKVLLIRKNERKRHLIKQFKLKQQKLIEHFKSTYESIIVSIQKKWNRTLERERKVVCKEDYKKFHKLRSESQAQLNIVQHKSRDVSFDIDTKLFNADTNRFMG